jgi:hypothetical protein
MALWRFEKMRLGWENQSPKNPAAQFKYLAPDQQAMFTLYIAEFKAAIGNLQLSPADDRLKKIDLRRSWENTSVAEMCTELQILSEVTIDELKRHVFIHVPAQKQEFADKPDQFFGASWNAYPSAQENMASACLTGHSTSSLTPAFAMRQSLRSAARPRRREHPC